MGNWVLSYPNRLWILALLPIFSGLFIYGRIKSKHAQHILASLHKPHPVKRNSHQALFFIATISLLIAFAQPHSDHQEVTIQQDGLQVVVLLDLSKSMLAEDVSPSRFEQAKVIVNQLSTHLSAQDEVALIAFTRSTQTVLPLNQNAALLETAVSQVHPSTAPNPGTLLQQALNAARRVFPSPSTGQPVILLLTDGNLHDDQAINFRQANPAIHLVAIGIGTEAGAPIPNGNNTFMLDESNKQIISMVDHQQLSQIFEGEYGRYLTHTEAINELPILLDAIRSQGATQTIITKKEQYQPFVWIGLLCLLCQWLLPHLPFTGSKRVPSTLAWRQFLFLLPILLISCQKPSPAQNISHGNKAFLAEDYDTAVDIYNAIPATSTFSPMAQYNLGNVYYQLGSYNKAQTSLETAVANLTHSLRLSATYNLGNSYYQTTDLENAIESYKTVLRHTPTDEDARYNLELALRQLNDAGTNGEEEDDNSAPHPLLPTANSDKNFNPESETAVNASLNPAPQGLTMPLNPQQALDYLQTHGSTFTWVPEPAPLEKNSPPTRID